MTEDAAEWTIDEYDTRFFAGEVTDDEYYRFWDTHCIRCGVAHGAGNPRLCQPCYALEDVDDEEIP